MRLCRIRLVTELATRNMTSRTLAAQAGVSRATVSAIKNGRSCSPETAAKIAAALNTSIENLLEGVLHHANI
jgi:putative transcriptional regulator